jgi:hypothetical protein
MAQSGRILGAVGDSNLSNLSHNRDSQGLRRLLSAARSAQKRFDRLFERVLTQTRWTQVKVLAYHHYANFVHLAMKELIHLIEYSKTWIKRIDFAH